MKAYIQSLDLSRDLLQIHQLFDTQELMAMLRRAQEVFSAEDSHSSQQ